MPPTAPAYRERLLPGIGGWSAAVAFAGILCISLWPVNHVLALWVSVPVAVLALTLLWWTSPVVSVQDGTLRAGRATIPVAMLGQADTLDRGGMTKALGPDLDARAYVCLRAWARTGVRVKLDDPADPTPYWLVSTRAPASLTAAITAARV